jgi:hypothetical protein
VVVTGCGWLWVFWLVECLVGCVWLCLVVAVCVCGWLWLFVFGCGWLCSCGWLWLFVVWLSVWVVVSGCGCLWLVECLGGCDWLWLFVCQDCLIEFWVRIACLSCGSGLPARVMGQDCLLELWVRLAGSQIHKLTDSQIHRLTDSQTHIFTNSSPVKSQPKHPHYIQSNMCVFSFLDTKSNKYQDWLQKATHSNCNTWIQIARNSKSGGL